jgi:hypothetical protein
LSFGGEQPVDIPSRRGGLCHRENRHSEPYRGDRATGAPDTSPGELLARGKEQRDGTDQFDTGKRRRPWVDADGLPRR